MNELTYAGRLTPREAWRLLAEDDDAVLVDVRTPEECTFVGAPDLSGLGKAPVVVPWEISISAALTGNPGFAGAFLAAVPDKATPVLMICRSGRRSATAAAAMTQAGYRRCYNVEGGFEGDKDAAGHRGRVNGWKVAGLPWTQD